MSAQGNIQALAQQQQAQLIQQHVQAQKTQTQEEEYAEKLLRLRKQNCDPKTIDVLEKLKEMGFVDM